MIDVIDKYPLLELNKHFSQLLDEGQMINLAEILQGIKNSTFAYDSYREVFLKIKNFPPGMAGNFQP